jgi:hypothetical protein
MACFFLFGAHYDALQLLFVEQMLAILVVGFGFWMSTHNDECRRSLTIPVMALGGVIFLMYAYLQLYPHRPPRQ